MDRIRTTRKKRENIERNKIKEIKKNMKKHWGLRMNLKENESKRKSIMDRKRRERKRAGKERSRKRTYRKTEVWEWT